MSANSLIQCIPKSLLDDLRQGRWLPIIGAGFSTNAAIPDGRPPVAWAELGRELSEDVDGLGSDAPVLEVLSAYEHGFGRVDLVDRTARLIRVHDAKPGPTHLAFARVGFIDVITTNFDNLLERAYEAVGKGCMPVIDETQLSAPNRYAGPRLIKMHGDIGHPDRLVLTEDDYDDFLRKYPLLATSITAMFVDRTTVLVGYSLDDPDTRQLLALVKSRLGKLARPMWAIQVAAPEHVVKRYERRGVKVINLPAIRDKSVGQQLEQLFEELGQHWRSSLPESSVSNDDRVAADLRVPGEPSRMCYFAIPLGLVPWYRDVIFPLVEERGMVPVTARDVLTPPGTVANKVDALIERAAMVVVELGGSYSDYEASLAIAQKPSEAVLLVVEEGGLTPANLTSYRMLQRPKHLEADPSEFVEVFAKWISEWHRQRSAITGEPERLLEHREYGAALISAVSLLEVTLNERLATPLETASSRPTSIRKMLREGQRQGLLAEAPELELIEQAVTTRNEVLHRGRKVTSTQAKLFVSAIRTFVDRL